MYTISDDQNLVTVDADNSRHQFTPVPPTADEDQEICSLCSLMNLCFNIAGRDEFEDFPFKCTERIDGQNGYFIPEE